MRPPPQRMRCARRLNPSPIRICAMRSIRSPLHPHGTKGLTGPTNSPPRPMPRRSADPFSPWGLNRAQPSTRRRRALNCTSRPPWRPIKMPVGSLHPGPTTPPFHRGQTRPRAFRPRKGRRFRPGNPRPTRRTTPPNRHHIPKDRRPTPTMASHRSKDPPPPGCPTKGPRPQQRRSRRPALRKALPHGRSRIPSRHPRLRTRAAPNHRPRRSRLSSTPPFRP